MSESEFSKRIRDLRAKHGLTLEQVAQCVGVGKSTVRKWETGMIENMRRDKIAKLAVALHTTPAYLMGWIDDENEPQANLHIAANRSDDLSPMEQTMIHKFRALDDRGQAAVLNVLDHEYNSLPGSKAASTPKEA